MQRRSVQRVDPHYKHKRQLNNISVQKSREKTRREHEKTMKSINQLEEDNEILLRNLQTLKEEYEQLRNLFQQHTGVDIDQMVSSTSSITSELSTSSIPSKEESKESSSKPVLTINTTEDQSSSSNQLDANNLDGSVVVINGVQYKIVSIDKN
ncbi:unnamed protein product [Rotaria sp. Silwood1]|nr:unnamed protein product [Rotaria sp. Silwood1]CAF3447424.1 unnamed protein product [Rotaria sp. Silwood1]CAF3478746.1 unnamed protein product [Rotaria sp. Silwood1]CAF3482062.1 unnamed protein product [Rotaria sp. Silwood1]CAF4871317.1 unnamed protein product [Rotaria sp. Silwood1]